MNVNLDKKETNANQSHFPFSASSVEGKKVILDYDGGSLSSDSGALILREIAQETGIFKAIANIIDDLREIHKIKHTLLELLTQRICQICCGYDDANDSNELRQDPIFKMIVGRAPESGKPLASQPTFSRLENSISQNINDQLEQLLIDQFIQSYPDAPSVIVLDYDQTNDTVHGNQQLSLFNDYYKEYCFMPLHVYEGLSGKLITTMLMPGKRPDGQELLTIVRPMIEKLRAVWPKTRIIFRGDSHFSCPQIHDWIDQQENVSFIIGQSGNSRLREQAQSVIDEAERRYKEIKQDVRRYHTIYYQAKTWSKMLRVAVKVEVTAKGANVRYVVSDMNQAKAGDLYKVVYCGRGAAELYIKDHKTYLKSDRTSCHEFEANRFRLALHSVAYILMHTLKTELLGVTKWANATMQTIQLKFFKVSARIRELKTRIKVEISGSYPDKDILRRCFQIMALIKTN